MMKPVGTSSKERIINDSVMLNWKIKYLRLRVKSKDYYSDRLNQLIAHKAMLDKRFRLFESGGIVGDRIWDLEGGYYLDYCYRIKPILRKRMAWYEKKIKESNSMKPHNPIKPIRHE